MGEKEDRRVKRTEAILKDALLALLQEKPAEKISVSELVKQADVGRGTFYLHYKDIADMIDHLNQICLNKLIPLLDTYSEEPDIEPFLLDLFKICEQEKDLLRLLPKNMNSKFYQHLKEFAREKCEHDWVALFHAEPEKIDLLFPYIFNGIVGLLLHWGDTNCAIPAEKMAHYTKNIIFNSYGFISEDQGIK